MRSRSDEVVKVVGEPGRWSACVEGTPDRPVDLDAGVLGSEEAKIERVSVISLRRKGQVEAEAEEEVQLEQVELSDADPPDSGPANLETIR